VPKLPYHEDNQVRKDKAFNDITCVIQQFLDNYITHRETVIKVTEIIALTGVQFDGASSQSQLIVSQLDANAKVLPSAETFYDRVEKVLDKHGLL